MAHPCRVLLIYPGFVPNTFWNYQATCELFNVRYPAAPLGLITVAAMLPQTWEVRLVDRNVEELQDEDILWADLVMTGGMINQQPDCLGVIDRCHALGKLVVVGGPDVTSSPHLYRTADFQVLGEAEDIIKDFIAAWERGERSGVFQAQKFQVDVTTTPMPRYDLLKFDRYFYICVQYSRGCPFTCEFCDIIELYGRVPRTKTNEQILAELDYLYRLGYRGHVDFVDDNLIGNKKAVKKFLPELKAWLQARDYPFEFSTEASINLADDDALLRMMTEANFFAVFVGIESPDPETLGGDAEEAEHAPRHCREHSPDLQRRHVRHRRIHHWFRQRAGIRSPTPWCNSSRIARSPWPWSACYTPCRTRSSRAGSPRKAGCMRVMT